MLTCSSPLHNKGMKDRKKIEENHVTNNPFEAGRLSDAAQWLKMLSKEQMHLVVEI